MWHITKEVWKTHIKQTNLFNGRRPSIGFLDVPTQRHLSYFVWVTFSLFTFYLPPGDVINFETYNSQNFDESEEGKGTKPEGPDSTRNTNSVKRRPSQNRVYEKTLQESLVQNETHD